MPKVNKPVLRQVNIIHISDLHFGKNHRFQAPISAMNDRPTDDGYPKLSAKFCDDLSSLKLDGPVLLCASGDFAEYAELKEFVAAEGFFKDLFAKKFSGFGFSKENAFIVAGNHDVVFDQADLGARMQQWTEFYNRLFETHFTRDQQLEMCQVEDRIDDFGCVVVTLNSSMFVQKGTPDEQRGRVSLEQLAHVKSKLDSLDQSKLAQSIKICMVHHHPVLIPQLVESGRGYDAIHNAGQMLQLLKKYNFHVVLHGHKHNPFTFTDDIEASHTSGEPHPIFFSCAGSLGSSSLPLKNGNSNCYNILTIKYHPEGDQFRVRCRTRKLKTHDNEEYELLPQEWVWQTVKVYDKFFQRPFKAVMEEDEKMKRPFDKEADTAFDKERTDTYIRTRGYLPYVQVKPSLMDGQAYEANCEIIAHPSPTVEPKAPPQRVEWSAGKLFEVKEVSFENDPAFRVTFQYYGSMLLQARLYFADEYVTVEHVYAPIPNARA